VAARLTGYATRSGTWQKAIIIINIFKLAFRIHKEGGPGVAVRLTGYATRSGTWQKKQSLLRSLN
jgi:hypothetical protein